VKQFHVVDVSSVPATAIVHTCSHGRPQASVRGGTCLPLWKCCKVFFASVVTAKRSVDKLFVRYFDNLSSASGGKAPRLPPGIHPWTPLGDFRPQTLNLPAPGKNLGAPMHVLPMLHVSATDCTHHVNFCEICEIR